MKKRRFANFLLLAPLALCAACAGGIQRVEISSNWYRNTLLRDDVAGTHETLEYTVTMSDSAAHNGLTASYTDGIYTMTLSGAPIALDDSSKAGYILETSLSVQVKFTYGGKESATLHDTVQTRVEFLPVGENLKPVSSVRTAHTHVPNDMPDSVDTAYTEYDYSYAVEYDDGLTKATVTYTDRLPGTDGKTPEPRVSEIDIEGKSTYLDNEQILFALRGMNLTSAPSFRTINPTMGSVQQVIMREAGKEVTEPVSFLRDGEPFSDEALAAYEIRPAYSNNIGQPRTIVLAKKGSPTDNVNRNVPLRMEYPILRSLGTLRYTLSKATFTDK